MYFCTILKYTTAPPIFSLSCCCMSLCPMDCEEPCPRFSNDFDWDRTVDQARQRKGCSCVSASVKRPVHETLQSAKRVHVNYSASIDPSTAVGTPFATHHRQSHRSSAWPQFIFDRLRNAIRIVLLHNWPEKLTLVEPLRLSGEILSAL
jgi:hypothetical protein